MNYEFAKTFLYFASITSVLFIAARILLFQVYAYYIDKLMDLAIRLMALSKNNEENVQ